MTAIRLHLAGLADPAACIVQELSGRRRIRKLAIATKNLARLLQEVPRGPVDSPKDIIPISSRREPRPPEATTPPAPVAQRRFVPGAAWALGLGAFGLVMGLAVGQWRGIDRLRALPDGVRADAYARAMHDIQMVCNPPATEDGPLGEHCRQQAQFVVVFPECAGDCRRLVDRLLPRARR